MFSAMLLLLDKLLLLFANESTCSNDLHKRFSWLCRTAPKHGMNFEWPLAEATENTRLTLNELVQERLM